jgi:Ca2+-binding EF-hand superfamily protein
MDTNGDGTVSQGELESTIEGQGGTQAQGDALYAGLSQNGSGNLTQTQLANDLQSAAPAHRGHHGHHHHGAAGQAGSKLVQAMDSNSDGSVDKSEFESFVTALGGTTGQADADFTSLQGQGSGGITATQFNDAVSAFEQSSAGGGSPVLDLLDGIAKTVSSTGTTNTTAA